MIVIFLIKNYLSLTYREGFQALSRRIFSYFDEGKSSVISQRSKASRRALIFIGETGECNFCHK